MSLNLAKFKTDLGTALKEAAALNDKDNVAKDTALHNIADKLADKIAEDDIILGISYRCV